MSVGRWDLPGGPVFKTLCFCRGHGFNPWPENLRSSVVCGAPKKKKKKKEVGSIFLFLMDGNNILLPILVLFYLLIL